VSFNNLNVFLIFTNFFFRLMVVAELFSLGIYVISLAFFKQYFGKLMMITLLIELI
jgi:hypothetical protein